MADPVADVLSRARDYVDPDEDERQRLEAVAAELTERAETAVADLPITADIRRVGSTARNTWLSGTRDIDLFVCFPPDLDRSELREYGLTVGHETIPDGREEYAEHPYVTGKYEGFDVDVVPCYAVEAATDIRSAVDRTPFHTTYVRERLTEELAAGVRLVKGFAQSIGVYGSDLRTRGMSGYLIELLVLEYGGARACLEAAAEWHPPVALDPESHGTETFDDPLVVVDPTDPERNVAAVCSAESVARFQHHAGAFLADPDISYFTPDHPLTITESVLRGHLDRRDTTPLAVVFDAPATVEDDRYPQLYTSESGIVGELERRGFNPLRSTVGVTPDETEAMIFLECGVGTLPAVQRHEGPPVHVSDHGERFVETYTDRDDVYGPFIDGDRYVVERPREFQTPVEWAQSDAIFAVKHGVDVESNLKSGYRVLSGDDVTDLLPDFESALAAHFAPSL